MKRTTRLRKAVDQAGPYAYKIIMRMTIVMVITFILMAVFEALKQTIYPNIQIWNSHIITIIFVTTVATLLSFFIAYRTITFHEKIVAERDARVLAEKMLSDTQTLAEIYLDLMSHDLRNINQIGIGYLEIALDTLKLDDEARALLKKPLEAFQNSTSLIDRIKKLQSVDDARLKYHEISVGDVLRPLIPRYAGYMERDIRIDFTHDAEYRVMANDLLGDVFSNIIENAVKHSEGPIHIDITMKEMMLGDKKYCGVDISDDGPGIPDRLKDHIFSRFDKDKANTHSRGLGLYLLKTLVEDFKGKVWVEDAVPGDYTRGAKFVTLLPLIAAL